MRIGSGFIGFLASLLLGASALADGAGAKLQSADNALEFVLDGDQWQPGSRYRSGDDWLALVCGRSDCRFEPAKLTVRREKWQGHYDDKPTMGQRLQFRRAGAGTGMALAWFKRSPTLDWLQAGPVATYWAASFKKQRPATKGTLELAVDLPDGTQATLVPLFDRGGRFLLQLRAQGERQLLGELGICSNEVSTDYLVWAGDIDRDGRPDYLISLIDAYGHAALYLASRAGTGKIAGVAAVYEPPPYGGECDGTGWLTVDVLVH